MFGNYLKIVLRNIRRNKGYSFINIAGLAIGIASCILILLWVQDELSYDRYHKNADNIARVTFEFVRPDHSSHFARVPYGWVNTLPEEYPEILDMVRIHHELKRTIRYGSTKYNEGNFFNADPNVFNIFSFKLNRGDPQNALAKPNSVVITEDMARKYFGDGDPMGQVLTNVSQYLDEETDYTVTGVMENIPANSHFHPDFLASQSSRREDLADEWNYIYLLLADGSDIIDLQKQCVEFVNRNTSPGWTTKPILHIQKLTDIHLRSDLDREIEPNGNIANVYVFTVIAALILLIACINFMNLSTARSSRRALEIGIRKTLGAHRRQLVAYFLGESVILSIIAFLLAVVLIELTMPLFSAFTGKSISANPSGNWHYLIILLIFPVITGLLAGSYPALFLSSLKPVTVLKAAGGNIYSMGLSGSRKRISVRDVLVIFQFAISVALIICCVITYNQHNYLMAQRLGSKGEQIVALPNVPVPAMRRYGAFRNELTGSAGIIDITASMEEPSKQILDGCPYTIDGVKPEEGADILFVMPVDYNFFNFFNIEFVAGRDFPPVYGDSVNGGVYILNESAVRAAGIASPQEAIGRTYKAVQNWSPMDEGPIIGVVKDFSFSNMRKKIKPLVYFQKPIWYWCTLIKLDPSDIPAALTRIESTWNKINPEYPFEYYFVNDLYATIYKSEQKQGVLLGIFSLLAVFVACLGLFGLAAYTVERRTKEVGIRKVFGASVSSIVMLLSKEFTRWVLLANIIAWPIAYFLMKRWLQDFAYRIEIGWVVFVLSAALALAIALLTISFQSLKAARTNPVETLRYE